jgi:hypothetical protein
MKKTIKGITYDTGKSAEISNYYPADSDYILYKTSSGRFFLHHRFCLVDGRPLPKNVDTLDIYPDLASDRNSKEFKEASKHISYRQTIKPLTRRQALAWCVRHNIPRTFHKDLARFLK